MRLSVGETLVSSIGPPPVVQSQTGSGATLTTFQLTSTQTGLLPFRIAIPLSNGLNSAASLITSADSSQVVIKRKWNNVSTKHVIIDGHAQLTANTPRTFNLVDTSAIVGTNLTSANIIAANPQATISFTGGIVGSVALASLINSPIRTWVSGPEAVECHYKTSFGGVLVFFHVRLYKNGRVHVLVSVENGSVDVVGSDITYSPVVTIGGIQIYNPGSITHFNHTRLVQEGWIGGDPQVTPKHNVLNLIATKLVPNYFMDTPPAAALNGLHQTYTPYGASDIAVDMTNTGPQPQIGLLPLWDSLFITSLADSRAFNSVIANAKAINNYSIVWRGTADNDLPCRPSIYPDWTVAGKSTVGPSFGGGGPPPGAGLNQWDAAHHGSAGYLAYMLTGDYFHLETMQHQAATGYLTVTWNNNYPSVTTGTGGVNRSLFAVAVRAAAWIDRTIGHYTAIAPNDSVFTDYSALLSKQADFGASVLQLPGVNQLGIIYEYDLFQGSGHDIPSISVFMHWFMVQVFGTLSDMEPLPSMTNWNITRDWLYKIPVNMLGTGAGGTYCFSQAAATFDYNFGNANAITSINDTHWAPNWQIVWSQTVGDINDSFPGQSLVCGTSLQGTSGSDPASGATSFWANLHPAIALAVDHGSPGATTSYNRLLGASNYSGYRNAVAPNDFASFPNFGIQPRVAIPSDALTTKLATMTAGTWADLGTVAGVTTATPSSVTPSPVPPGDPTGVTRTWSGGCLDTTNDMFIIWGGGHTDYAGNEVYALPFNTLNWTLLTQPSVSDLNNTGVYADGRPASKHSYSGITFLPNTGEMLVLDGAHWNNGFGDSHCWRFNTTTHTWTQTAPIPQAGNVGSVAAWDSVSQRAYWFSCAGSISGIQIYDPSANTWSAAGQVGFSGGTEQTGAIDTLNHRLVCCGNGFLIFLNLTTGALTDVSASATGDKTAQNYAAPGFEWHPPTNQFVAFVPGNSAVWLLNPTTFVWTKHNANISNSFTPPAEDPGSRGVWGRWRYSPNKNCFVAVVDYTFHAVTYKPDF